MVLVGIALVFGLYSWWLGEPNYPRLLLNAVIALYLNQSAVREAVGERRRGARRWRHDRRPARGLRSTTWSCCARTSRSCATTRASCSSRPPSRAISPSATCSWAPSERDRPGGRARGRAHDRTSRHLRRAARQDALPAPRPEAAQRHRARPLAAATGPAGFRAPGRLARVGLFARLVDAGFNASLLLRGTVPGGTAAAAQIKYAAAFARTIRATSTTAASCGATAGSCSSTCSSTS